MQFIFGLAVGIAIMTIVMVCFDLYGRGKDGTLTFDFVEDMDDPVGLVFAKTALEMMRKGYVSIKVVCKTSRDKQSL